MRDVLRIGRVMLMGAIERAASNGATSEAGGEETVVMPSLVAKRKRIRQMFSLV